MTNNIMYSLKRKFLISELTGNLGRVEETEDKLICYVDNKKLTRIDSSYMVELNGYDKYEEDFYQYYKLAKPITYIIEDKDFTKGEIYIYGENDSEIIIKNSNFRGNLYIETEGNCIMNDNCFGSFLNINIKSDNLQISNVSMDSNTCISLISKNNISLTNVVVGNTDDKTDVEISAEEINIDGTKIYAGTLSVDTSIINADSSSSIFAKNNLIVRNRKLSTEKRIVKSLTKIK